MKKYSLVVVLMLVTLLITTNLAYGMQTARVSTGEGALTYSVQLADETEALSLAGDFGLSDTIGLNGIFTYTENVNYLDLNAKLKFIEDYDLSLAGLVGVHRNFDDSSFERQLGMVITHRLSQFINLNGAVITQLGVEDNSVGIELGIDYEVFSNTELQAGYRRLAGQEGTDGIMLGLRSSL
ncbi:hypothetical protein [Fuchsiella alkaliacetigena]|uniref:hypothetical protein n=1 Tax=Fuchsiella alkaliacetigena TaxID=957042 RepID=UPI00200A0D02|nr:hypothetical protein [Fuchsiella alkaliacetigena]MCK8824164.1 hypothetical protein [Fuchsiella alkaliacetigena]